jgi:hypothetical protein
VRALVVPPNELPLNSKKDTPRSFFQTKSNKRAGGKWNSLCLHSQKSGYIVAVMEEVPMECMKAEFKKLEAEFFVIGDPGEADCLTDENATRMNGYILPSLTHLGDLGYRPARKFITHLLLAYSNEGELSEHHERLLEWLNDLIENDNDVGAMMDLASASVSLPKDISLATKMLQRAVDNGLDDEKDVLD